jgi:CDP-diglyceride synthetase
VAYDPQPWHEYYVMLGSAAAALAGLVFVGLSIHADAVAVDPLHRLRARNLTAGIIYVTAVAALMLTPGQGRRALGLELIAGGLIIGWLFATPLRRFHDRIAGSLRMRMIVSVGACLISVIAGTSLLAHEGGGLYLLVPAAIAGVTLNVFGAWSLLIDLAEERRAIQAE